MNDMKVLHFIPGMHGGGAERQLALLAKCLVQKGVETHVGYCVDGENSQLLRQAGCEIHKLGDLHFYDPRLWRDIKNLMNEIKPDVVATWLEPMDIAAGKAALQLGIPWIVCERSRGPFLIDRSFKSVLRKRWRIAIARKAAAIICNSQFACDNWTKTVNIPCHAVGNIMEADDFDTVQPAELSRWSIPENRPMILMAGRLEQPKNYFFAIDALKNINAEVFIFGTGKLRKKLQAKLDKQGLTNRVRLLGYCNELPAWLKRCDLLVSTSLYEGCPNTVMEAIACGTPVVLSDIPQHRIFTHANAVLGSISSPEQFAEIIKNALKSPQKPDKTFLERFSPSRIADEYIEIFKKASNSPIPCR